MAGSMRKAIRLQTELELACFVFQRTESCFLGGFVEEVCDCVISGRAVSRAWAAA